MIELTEQQARAIEQPDTTPPRLIHPRTRQRFVVLPDDEYERLTSYDGGSWTDEDRDSVRAEALEALGWEGMEVYQDDQPISEDRIAKVLGKMSTAVLVKLNDCLKTALAVY